MRLRHFNSSRRATALLLCTFYTCFLELVVSFQPCLWKRQEIFGFKQALQPLGSRVQPSLYHRVSKKSTKPTMVQDERRTWRSGKEQRNLPAWIQEFRRKASISRRAQEEKELSSKMEPQRFLRLQRNGDRCFELQTAIVRYRTPWTNSSDADSKARTIDFISLVHLADPKYYQELQALAEEGYDQVLFELITDSKLVDTDASGRKRLNQRLDPATDQRVLARKHGLQAQLEGMDLTGDKWTLADLDKASIDRLKIERGETSAPSLLQTMAAGWGSGDIRVLPTQLQTMLRTWLRTPIWLVPCPEGAMLILDWALSEKGRLSDVLGAMLDSLLGMDLKTVSKLAFAQLLVSGSMRCDGPQTVIISERNKAALEALKQFGGKSTALMYGGMHGDDLDRRLRNELGLERCGCEWKTAWRIYVPPARELLSASVCLGAALAAYLFVDGFDWLATIAGVADEVSGGNWDMGVALVVAYLARHAVVYWQIGRVFVSWDSTPFEYAASLEIEDSKKEEESDPKSP